VNAALLVATKKASAIQTNSEHNDRVNNGFTSEKTDFVTESRCIWQRLRNMNHPQRDSYVFAWDETVRDQGFGRMGLKQLR
jgi:hypothetical protein